MSHDTAVKGWSGEVEVCALWDSVPYTIPKEHRSLSIVKPTRCTISQIYFILEQRSTCFRWSLRTSSGV